MKIFRYFSVSYLDYIPNIDTLVGFDFPPHFSQHLEIENPELEGLKVGPNYDGSVLLVLQESPQKVPKDWTVLAEMDTGTGTVH